MGHLQKPDAALFDAARAQGGTAVHCMLIDCSSWLSPVQRGDIGSAAKLKLIQDKGFAAI